MPHPLNRSREIAWVLFLALLATPIQAHKVQVTQDVGGTLHIEPNDTPRAGESALTWFALTRKGGRVIPLEQCNCQLSVYAEPLAANEAPILTPSFKAVSAEQYQDIPAAEIQFPQPGTYQLQLSGTPKAGGDFQAFELMFEVTVATGTSVPKASSQATPSLLPPRQSQQQMSWQTPAVIALASILGLGLLWRIGGRENKK